MTYYMSRVEEELQYLSKEIRRINARKRRRTQKKPRETPQEEITWVYLPIGKKSDDD